MYFTKTYYLLLTNIGSEPFCNRKRPFKAQRRSGLKNITYYSLQLRIPNDNKLDTLSFLCNILLLRHYSLCEPYFVSFGGWNPPLQYSNPFITHIAPVQIFLNEAKPAFKKVFS